MNSVTTSAHKGSTSHIQLVLVIITLLITLISCGGGDAPNANQAPKFISGTSYSTLDNVLETGYRSIAIDNDGDAITYSITGGVDELDFLIDPITGAVSFVLAPDFENPDDENVDNIYELEISATDNNDASTQLRLKITVSGNSVMLRIPVVVHVLYQDNPEHESNISEDKILSQIAVLNKDYRKINTDLANVPEEFKSVIADIEIEFEMAQLDPDGEATNGITRTLDQLNGMYYSNDIHFSASGGHDAWPTNQYLNIWVFDGADRHGNIAVGGKGQFPGGDPLTDGVIIAYQAFGTIEPIASNQGIHLGRTATHEIGHWLNLRHLDGNYSCDTDDGVDDTPVTSTLFPDHPTYPTYSCGSSDMFMNFMTSIVDDDELIMFTEGQKARIHAVFAVGGERTELYESLTQ